MEKVKYEDLIEYLKDNVDTLRDMASEVNSYNGALDNNVRTYDETFKGMISDYYNEESEDDE